ncbi:cytochrome c family protein [Telmatospirillum sp. J64-1]|uniref:c-type cytochrome n=1 Tax=Telmatospirillum sp. J64-1 TaxID=2502183 RepID=UPI00115DD3F3|nr:cytochrome c family protein [Telmatospirillum sp. J64-1]
MRKIRMAVLAAAVGVAAFSTAASAGDAAKGEKVFKRCVACHTVDGKSKATGPTLAGVVGRAAGSLEDFKYSPAMAGSGKTWDEASLDAYLTKPKDFIPGNKMAFPGLPKAEDRADVIAYLSTLK